MKKKYTTPHLLIHEVRMRHTLNTVSQPSVKPGDSDTSQDNLSKTNSLFMSDDGYDDFE